MGLISKLTAIADAIRTKLGTTDKMTMDEMASNIEAIPVGSDTWDRFVSGNMESVTLNQESIPVGFLMGYQGGLKSLKITNASTVPNDAFKSIPETYEPQIVDVDFGDVVETIGDYAFYKQEKIEKITGMNSLKEVGTYAFSEVGENAAGVVETLPSSAFLNITKLGSNAFSHCSLVSNIVNIGLSDTIQSNCFTLCANLESVEFAEAKHISSNIFASCTKLKSASFPKATSIDSGAFWGCTSLESVNLPLCETLSSSAFNGAFTGDINIDMPKLQSIGATCFSSCKARSLLLGTGLTDQSITVGEQAFRLCNCESIGLAFENIPKNCFYHSYVLTDIYITNTTGVATFSGSGWFTGCYRLFGTYDETYNPSSIKGAVHVPPNLLDAYKADTGWINNFIGNGGEIVAID